MTDPEDQLYKAVPFASLPGWQADDQLDAFRAFCTSVPGLVAAVGSLRNPLTQIGIQALAQQTSIDSREAARAFFETNFEPARVVHEGPAGLLTGYYEPVIDGSLTCEGPFTVAIYKRPPDLENIVSEAERSAASGGYSHMRRTGEGLEPYATREEIERGALEGQGLELLYLSDPVAAFFLHVQGSGAIRLPRVVPVGMDSGNDPSPLLSRASFGKTAGHFSRKHSDGSIRRITYDGKNGHPYTSVGRTLIEDGSFQREDVTLQAMSEWLGADLERARRVLWRNRSFVFFRFLDAEAPIGVMGTPLHPLRSLAVDPAFHALGAPVYVSAPELKQAGGEGFHRLMVAHDVGSAIKGPERGDIFYGTGEAALAGAGVTKHPGTFFVLVPRGML